MSPKAHRSVSKLLLVRCNSFEVQSLQETADLKFSVGGKSIYAHKLVLKLCSQYFRSMFENNWKESIDSG